MLDHTPEYKAGGLFIIPGLGNWDPKEKIWRGIQPGEERVVETLIKEGCEIFRANQAIFDICIFSGGKNRPEDPTITNTEAEGMLAYASQAGLISPALMYELEESSEDTGRNIRNSILRYYILTGFWPERIGMVLLQMKEARTRMMAYAHGFGRETFIPYTFFPELKPAQMIKPEDQWKDSVGIYDPTGDNHQIFDGWLNSPDFRNKVFARRNMPSSLGELYKRRLKKELDPDFDANINIGGTISRVIDLYESTPPGKEMRVREQLPWFNAKVTDYRPKIIHRRIESKAA